MSLGQRVGRMVTQGCAAVNPFVDQTTSRESREEKLKARANRRLTLA